jgi:integrase
MGLEIQRAKGGALRSKWWYGRFTINGNASYVNLGVEIAGRVPAALRKRGDDTFELSRMRAKVKLDELIFDARSKKTAEHHLEELYEIKAGESLEQVPLAEIEQCWLNLPSRRKRTKLWKSNQCATLKKFREFVEGHHPTVKMLAQITPRIAQEWLRTLDDKGYAPATYNDKLHLLKGFFDRIGHECGIVRNPFAGCPSKIKATVHHQPFTQDELNRILKHADDLMRPVFIVGMCTAMRQGDCCLLKWEQVDLLEGFIIVKTSKTGELAEIPLFPVLRAEIEKQPRKSEYVFPEIAAMYQRKNFGMSWRVKQVLKAAEIETKQVCTDRLQDATIKGFHSLRTTWITMALSAGVPMELVRRVTGHSTVEVVLKHYFRPGREAFRTALETVMPKMITGGEEKESIDPHKALKKLAQAAPELKPEELVKKIKDLAAVLAA